MPEAKKLIPWHSQSVSDVLEAFSSSKDGLSVREVQSRLEEYGRNVLPEKKPKTVWRIVLSQFTSPLMGILIIAGLASAILGEWFDSSIILAAALLNTVLGFFEEYKADRSLEKLKAFLPRSVRVRRDGEVVIIQYQFHQIRIHQNT